MNDIRQDKKFYTLFELNNVIKAAIDLSMPESFWVAAEIAEAKCNQKGHCYLELVEKADSKIVAQIRATIWAYDYRKIGQKFEKATGERIRNGMKILFLASVTFHEVYGLSLGIKDIDPVYTLGEMALRKREVIELLRKEGVLERNRALALPQVPQRIAVISSPTAAGYGDFFHQLDNNRFGYRISHNLFPAIMQGQEAEASIVAALDSVCKSKERFDLAVIVRGGGSVTDLHWFDSHAVAHAIALFPIPVITGIGHEKDDTVADIVAHTKMKTPTAVAEFIISGIRGFEEKVLGAGRSIKACTETFLKNEYAGLERLVRGFGHFPLRFVAEQGHRVALLERGLISCARHYLSGQESKFAIFEKTVQHLDPTNVLRRGYSITRHKGAVVKDPATLKKWAVIETTLHKGTVKSIVQEKKEEKEIGEKSAGDLLPGFE